MSLYRDIHIISYRHIAQPQFGTVQYVIIAVSEMENKQTINITYYNTMKSSISS